MAEWLCSKEYQAFPRLPQQEDRRHFCNPVFLREENIHDYLILELRFFVIIQKFYSPARNSLDMWKEIALKLETLSWCSIWIIHFYFEIEVEYEYTVNWLAISNDKTWRPCMLLADSLQLQRNSLAVVNICTSYKLIYSWVCDHIDLTCLFSALSSSESNSKDISSWHRFSKTKFSSTFPTANEPKILTLKFQIFLGLLDSIFLPPLEVTVTPKSSSQCYSQWVLLPVCIHNTCSLSCNYVLSLTSINISDFL